MSLEQLINEYKTLPVHCFNVNYADNKALKRNNDSAKRMYEIVELIRDHYGAEGVRRISRLLDVEDYKTNRWLATQLLEKVKLDDEIKIKALSIIEQIAESDDPSAIGFQIWLQNWQNGKFVQ
jgi:aspartate oxidase